MRQSIRAVSLSAVLSQFLTPQLWKQIHQTDRCCGRNRKRRRWQVPALLFVTLSMAWGCGDTQEERFATARAIYVACHQHERRPGETLAGFLKALARLPMPVLRVVVCGVRAQLSVLLLAHAALGGGLIPFACDGSRIECPRSAELERYLGEAGKPDSAPTMYLTTLALLPFGLPWAWRWGRGTASELDHLRRLLPTLPSRALIIADAFYVGYDLYRAILASGASFLVRMSSRVELFTLEQTPATKWQEGEVLYWPQCIRDAGHPPIRARLLRVRGNKVDVWLLTNVLDRQVLSHRQAGQLDRWRWKNEGLFRQFKRLLGKVKLQSRTVALAHREAEIAMLGLQLLLAVTAQNARRGQHTVIVGCPRATLLAIRGAMIALLRTLGPRQIAQYQEMITVVRSQSRRQRTTAKARRQWPRRKIHKPPKPPKIRVLDETLKQKLANDLPAA